MFLNTPDQQPKCRWLTEDLFLFKALNEMKLDNEDGHLISRDVVWNAHPKRKPDLTDLAGQHL